MCYITRERCSSISSENAASPEPVKGVHRSVQKMLLHPGHERCSSISSEIQPSRTRGRCSSISSENAASSENHLMLWRNLPLLFIKGNDIAETLAVEATTDGTPASLPFPKSYLKNQLLQLFLSRWQAEWDNGETGRSVCSIIPKISNKQLHWSRECIDFATGHGPFPSYLKRFGLHSTDYCACGEIGNPLHYATRCPLTLSYHHKEPSPQFIVHWWKSALSSKLSRRNIDHLNHIPSD
ncbi:hypothetical protein AVEN_19594-1 [Araneus ventricosus]|uniref:Reverse transcriptase zinc-binding domain-containing protein n=1 Tax=Araneus ventricosus TaxID=182803 RepID=A0A4Y2KX00_ARAVE|nr:hypothetical protein AVEN_19594-1 [Araneus ventricosus]